MWSTKPLLLRGKLGFEFPPVAGTHARGGVNGKIVFQPRIPATVWGFLFA